MFNSTRFKQLTPYFLPSVPVKQSGGRQILENSLSIKSSIIKVSTTGRFNDQDIFGGPLDLVMSTDEIRKGSVLTSDPTHVLCLGVVDWASKLWRCSERDAKGRSSLYNTLRTRKMYYTIQGPGTYAVILRPKFDPNQKPTAYKGIITSHKPQVLMILVCFIPVLVLLGGAMVDIFKFESYCKDVKDDRKFLKEEADRLGNITADFVGQKIADKVHEGIEYYVNPVHRSADIDIPATAEVNREIEKIEFQKDEKDITRAKLKKKKNLMSMKIHKYREQIDGLSNDQFEVKIGIDVED